MAETVYKDFKREEMEYQFNPRTTVTEHPPLTEEREKASEATRAKLKHHRDVRYGDGPRMTLDIFPAEQAGAPVQIYIHGGFWRGGSKDAYSFISEPFVEAGATMVLLEYDLCPQVTVPDIMRETREGIAWIYRNIAEYGGDPERIYLSGSSAGGHLTARALSHRWEEDGLPEDIINVGFRDSVIIESFEQQGRWTVFTDTTRAGALPDDARLSTAQARDGEYGMSYRWNREVRSGVPRGVRLIGPDAALPVIVSRDFLVEAALDEGQLALVGMAGVYIPMQIVGAFDLFPTWDPEDARSLIIANRDYLSYRINRNPATLGAGTPNEVWIQPTDEEGLRQLRTFLEVTPPWKHDIYDVDAIRNLQDEDPLVAAGWEGLLFLTFIAIVLLAALGFLVASVLVAQQQQGEFAVLRTMGFSLPQVLLVVGIEKLLIIGVSMALGTAVGLQLGTMMLEFVGFIETGETVLPPFVTVTDWATIGGAYGVLGLVFLGAIAVIVALYMRMTIGQILRIGAE